MGRESIEEMLRNGPPLTFVAEKLGISRPTLYRQIKMYRDGNEQKMIDTVREYFDMVVIGDVDSEESARKQLEQIAYLAEAKGESKVMEISKANEQLMIARMEYSRNYRDMTTEEKVEAQMKIDRLEEEIGKMEGELDSGPLRDRFGRRIDRMVWNDGEIRSAVLPEYSSARIFIDADFDRCRGVWVELSVDVSGEDFTFARMKPQENNRYVDIENLPGNTTYKYTLRWNDGDKQKTAGPYDILMDSEF